MCNGFASGLTEDLAVEAVLLGVLVPWLTTFPSTMRVRAVNTVARASFKRWSSFMGSMYSFHSFGARLRWRGSTAAAAPVGLPLG